MLPADAPVASSDAEVAALIEGRTDTGTTRIIGLDDGDLARTLGIRKPYDRATPKQLLPVDAIEIELDDGSSRLCIAHTIVGNFLLDSQTTALMNAAFIGKRNIAPRAHPGDGLVEVVTMTLSPSDRYKAQRRMVTGSHLPHPGIKVRRLADGVLDLGRPRTVRIDGQACGRSTTIRFRVVSEAIVIASS